MALVKVREKFLFFNLDIVNRDGYERYQRQAKCVELRSFRKKSVKLDIEALRIFVAVIEVTSRCSRACREATPGSNRSDQFRRST
jgi:hypothetical protein